MNSQDLLTVILLIIVFISFFGVLGYSLRLRHQQKMELIKRGDIIFENKSLVENMKYSSLIHGILLISLSVGLFISKIITSLYFLNSQIIIYVAICCLSVGLGLIIFYFISRNRD